MRVILLRFIRWAAPIVSCLCLFAAMPVQASEHGGGAPAAAPLKFTVNLGSPFGGHYLQFEVVLESASPEVGQAIALYRPKIQHQVILLLSGEEEEALRTRKGKEELMDKIQETVNKILNETAKTGVTEVLFTNFIIQ